MALPLEVRAIYIEEALAENQVLGNRALGEKTSDLAVRRTALRLANVGQSPKDPLLDITIAQLDGLRAEINGRDLGIRINDQHNPVYERLNGRAWRKTTEGYGRRPDY